MAPKLRLSFVAFLLLLGVCQAEPGGQDAPFWAGKLWAQYSPYAPAGSYQPPPQDCTIKQVNIVSSDSRSCSLSYPLVLRSSAMEPGTQPPALRRTTSPPLPNSNPHPITSTLS